MMEKVQIHRDDMFLASSEKVLGFLKIIGLSVDKRFVTIEADRLERRELIRNGIQYIPQSEISPCLP